MACVKQIATSAVTYLPRDMRRHDMPRFGAGLSQIPVGRNATNEAVKKMAVGRPKFVRESSALGKDVETNFDLVRIVKLVEEDPDR